MSKAALLLWFTLLAAGCSGGSGATEGTLIVSAAASLTDAFMEMETEFESTHTDVNVILNFAASSTIREQIFEGAPVDVFASADPANMDRVAQAGELDGDPTIFAINRMEIAVPPDNPAGITGLTDFGRGELLVGLCAEGVPCGDHARRVLDNAGVTPDTDTNEPDVRALLAKIQLGELDAGIVYRTDVAAADDTVLGIAIPDAVNVDARYPIAILANASNREGAESFVDFVVSEAGRSILTRHGFSTP